MINRCLNIFPVSEFFGTERTLQTQWGIIKYSQLEILKIENSFILWIWARGAPTRYVCWAKVYLSKSFRRTRMTFPHFFLLVLYSFSLGAVWRDGQAHTRTWNIHHKFHKHSHFRRRDEHDASEGLAWKKASKLSWVAFLLHFDFERRGCKLDTGTKIEHVKF